MGAAIRRGWGGAVSGAQNLAKAGVLGGVALPLMGYHMTNYLTAPLIIWGQLGGRIALTSFDPDALLSMKYLYSMRLPGGRVADRVLFRSPDGKVWTSAMVADVVSTRSIARSQAVAEVSSKIIDDVVRQSGRDASGVELTKMRQLLRDTNRIVNPFTGLNFWGEMASASDTMWRTGVLTRALKQGRSVEEAVVMAREALFDYGRLSVAEKEHIAKYFWFWRFQRENMRSVIRAFINNPSRTLHLAKISKGAFTDGEYHLESREWNQNRPFLFLVNSDAPARERYAVHGPSVPFVEGLSQILGIMSFAAPLFDKGVKPQSRVTEMISDTLGGLASRAKPGLKIGAAAAGVEIAFDRVEPSGTYLDPRLVALLHASGRWDWFTGYVNVEAVVPQPGESTFNLKRWRIPYNDKSSRATWGMMKAALQAGGQERTIRDYASWFIGEREGEITGPELQAAPGIEQLRNMGVLRVSPDTPPRDLSGLGRTQAKYELKDRTP